MQNRETKQATTIKTTEVELPQSIIDSYARFLVPEIRKYFESEQGQKEFAKWKEENLNKDK